jgi:hypothetical protein
MRGKTTIKKNGMPVQKMPGPVNGKAVFPA